MNTVVIEGMPEPRKPQAGDIYQHPCGDLYLMTECVIGNGTGLVAHSLTSGRRWSDSVENPTKGLQFASREAKITVKLS
jgi:hypothetical protein